MTEQEWDAVIAVHLKGTYKVIFLFLLWGMNFVLMILYSVPKRSGRSS